MAVVGYAALALSPNLKLFRRFMRVKLEMNEEDDNQPMRSFGLDLQ
jgi:hypothetical protein